jgi:long-subunit fatty acid transport protein
MTSRPRLVSLLAALAVLAAAAPASAQFELGEQRAGTTSGQFLKIGLGARAVGLGESFVAVANDPSAIFWNPAGLASLQRQEIALSHVGWPGDINYEHVTWVIPSKHFGGSFGLQFGVLSTEMEETSELQPFGTGRNFLFTDMVAGVAYARRWTDKLLVGAGAKFVREDLGSDVGGPTTSATLFDLGSIFYLGYGSVRIATSLTNFGSELRPSGDYVSPYNGDKLAYDGFDPPIMFRYGVAFEPVESAEQRLTASLEFNQPADNSLRSKAGLEWTHQRVFSLRGGYNFNADALKLSAGAGVVAKVGHTQTNVDYAYTDGGSLGAISRLSLGFRF